MVIDSLAATGRGIYPSGFARQVPERAGPDREFVRKELECLIRCKQTQGRTTNYLIEYQEFDPEYEQLRHEIS